MLTYLLKFLGLNPTGTGKTGKREASWGLVCISLAITIAVIVKGDAMMGASVGLLCILWPSAILAVAGAYKLEHDKRIFDKRGDVSNPPIDIIESPSVTAEGLRVG